MSAVYGDGHVHIYPAFDLHAFFDAARKRSQALDAPLLLLLSESSGHDVFRELRRAGATASPSLEATQEARSLHYRSSEGHKGSVLLIAGRQFISQEGLEVLALGLDPDVPLAATPDGALPAEELIERSLQAQALAVLPWGVGKWLGRRRAQVERLAHMSRFQANPGFFLGDIAQRAWPWPTPSLFYERVRVLAGTDLLPLPGKESGIASYGFCVHGEFDAERPATSLHALMQQGTPLANMGRRDSTPRMLRDQLQLRLGR